MINKIEKCIFCDSTGIEATFIAVNYSYRVDCPLCMTYIVNRTAIEDNIINDISKEDRILFSAHLRNSYVKSHSSEILSRTIKNIPETVAAYKRLTPMDKASMVITYFAKLSTYFGYTIEFNRELEYTRFYCHKPFELKTIENYLLDKHLILRQDSGIVLTMDGWKAYETLKEINLNSKKVFVAMNFNANLKNIFDEAIYPACKECGFEAFRVDSKEHNEKICDKIISDIKSARFLIADFTEQRYGVYFEAGFAQGLRLKVIWTCKKGEENKLHFDTRQYNHIIWESLEDFKVQLINRIKATID